MIHKAVNIMGVIRNPGQGEPQPLDPLEKTQGNPFVDEAAKAYAPSRLEGAEKNKKKRKRSTWMDRFRLRGSPEGRKTQTARYAAQDSDEVP